MRTDNSTQFNYMTTRDLTPLEHKLIGSTVDPRYLEKPDIPLSVQDGELLEEVAERRGLEEQIIDSVTGNVVTDRVVAAVLKLGDYDLEKHMFREPELVGFYNEITKGEIAITEVDLARYRGYLDESRRELAELFEPQEGYQEISA